MTSHARIGVSNHRRLVCWFNSLFKLTTNTTPKFRITDTLRGESTDNRRIPLTNGQ